MIDCGDQIGTKCPGVPGRAPEMKLGSDIFRRRLRRIACEWFPFVRLIYGAADLCWRLCDDDYSRARRRHARNNRSNRLRLRMRLTTLFAGTVLMSDTRVPPRRMGAARAEYLASRLRPDGQTAIPVGFGGGGGIIRLLAAVIRPPPPARARRRVLSLPDTVRSQRAPEEVQRG